MLLKLVEKVLNGVCMGTKGNITYRKDYAVSKDGKCDGVVAIYKETSCPILFQEYGDTEYAKYMAKQPVDFSKPVRPSVKYEKGSNQHLWYREKDGQRTDYLAFCQDGKADTHFIVEREFNGRKEQYSFTKEQLLDTGYARKSDLTEYPSKDSMCPPNTYRKIKIENILALSL